MPTFITFTEADFALYALQQRLECVADCTSVSGLMDRAQVFAADGHTDVREFREWIAGVRQRFYGDESQGEISVVDRVTVDAMYAGLLN